MVQFTGGKTLHFILTSSLNQERGQEQEEKMNGLHGCAEVAAVRHGLLPRAFIGLPKDSRGLLFESV